MDVTFEAAIFPRETAKSAAARKGGTLRAFSVAF